MAEVLFVPRRERCGREAEGYSKFKKLRRFEFERFTMNMFFYWLVVCLAIGDRYVHLRMRRAADGYVISIDMVWRAW